MEFLRFTKIRLGNSATHRDIGLFIRSREFIPTLRSLPIPPGGRAVQTVEIRKKTKHWTEVNTAATVHRIAYPAVAARRILPRHIRRCQSSPFPQLLIPVDRRGSSLHMYLLAPTGLKRKLVIWDPSNAVDEDAMMPWFLHWNCVQLNIASVQESYPIVVRFKTTKRKGGPSSSEWTKRSRYPAWI